MTTDSEFGFVIFFGLAHWLQRSTDHWAACLSIAATATKASSPAGLANSIFFCYLLKKKIIDLPAWETLQFLPSTPSSPSQTLGGLFDIAPFKGPRLLRCF